VTVTDAHPVTVTLITPYGTSPMHGSGSSYSATVGAPSAGGTLNFVVKAVDSLGHKAPNKVGSINLPSCDTTTTTAPPTTTTTTTVRPPS
jgi:hypothetical protein